MGLGSSPHNGSPSAASRKTSAAAMEKYFSDGINGNFNDNTARLSQWDSIKRRFESTADRVAAAMSVALVVVNLGRCKRKIGNRSTMPLNRLKA